MEIVWKYIMSDNFPSVYFHKSNHVSISIIFDLDEKVNCFIDVIVGNISCLEICTLCLQSGNTLCYQNV